MNSFPTSKEVRLDILEWYSFLLISNPSQVSELMTSLEELTPPELESEGRIWNRLLLAGIIFDVSILKEEHHYDELSAKLQEAKSSLLNLNANVYPVTASSDKLDEDLQSLPIFNELFNEITTLLSVLKRVHQTDFRSEPNLAECYALLTSILPQSLQDHECAESVLSAKTQDQFLQALDTFQSKVLEQFSTKLVDLIQTWHEQIITFVPKLAQCGYGGVQIKHPSIQSVDTDDDNKTVSSWGMDEDEEEERAKFIAAAGAAPVAAGGKRSLTRRSSSVGDIGTVAPLQVRPRQIWNQDFTLVTKSDQSDGEDDDQTADKRKIAKRNKARSVWSDDDDEPMLRKRAPRRRRRQRRQQTAVSVGINAEQKPIEGEEEVQATTAKDIADVGETVKPGAEFGGEGEMEAKKTRVKPTEVGPTEFVICDDDEAVAEKTTNEKATEKTVPRGKEAQQTEFEDQEEPSLPRHDALYHKDNDGSAMVEQKTGDDEHWTVRGPPAWKRVPRRDRKRKASPRPIAPNSSPSAQSRSVSPEPDDHVNDKKGNATNDDGGEDDHDKLIFSVCSVPPKRRKTSLGKRISCDEVTHEEWEAIETAVGKLGSKGHWEAIRKSSAVLSGRTARQLKEIYRLKSLGKR